MGKINADKVDQWKKDVEASVRMYNDWFERFAPITFREQRRETIQEVERAFSITRNLTAISPETIKAATGHPIVPTLRMCTAPPIARDRLVGLSYTSKSLVGVLEEGKLPVRMKAEEVGKHLDRICNTILNLLDRDIFPWIETGTDPEDEELKIAATIVADRLCGAVSDPIIRNAQEVRQLEKIKSYLEGLGYEEEFPEAGQLPMDMRPGTFCFRYNIKVGLEKDVNIPVDVIIQPRSPRSDLMPILIEAKSAGDFTNTNKRRKEEATKIRQLKDRYGEDTQLILFLCGYFDAGYLGYEAAEGLDWVWEHRIEDLALLGL